jgi:hypothetical protein
MIPHSAACCCSQHDISLFKFFSCFEHELKKNFSQKKEKNVGEEQTEESTNDWWSSAAASDIMNQMQKQKSWHNT